MLTWRPDYYKISGIIFIQISPQEPVLNKIKKSQIFLMTFANRCLLFKILFTFLCQCHCRRFVPSLVSYWSSNLSAKKSFSKKHFKKFSKNSSPEMLKKGLSCICQSEGKLFLIFKSFLNHHSVFENSFYTHPPCSQSLDSLS